ncbi:hypothetical protein BDD43_5956 [Mucilaginibacter gracilis]|uniref:Uncharacterized protein n=1 Tax=Mucilaginibacter gracilis TaxID=423350 RepID=A0A495J9S6_9SPHI|nr:DUF6169 family protein [Mucilaginibacter gracilis]RKR85685.1 hypothetical protein BDD43_5956 [Mucilaginibacter gracilis]
MLSLYKIYPEKEGYRFTTTNGDEYYAYFTPFTLQTPYHTTTDIVSFGFECKRRNAQTKPLYDECTARTIVHIINNYFKLNGDNALLYICLNNDDFARHRNLIFGKWFNEFGRGYERHKSDAITGEMNFYSSILIKEDNPEKIKLIEAFYFTINYWFPNE